MSLLTILTVLIIVGVLVYLVNRFIPMDELIKKIFNIVAIGGTILWILKILGAFAFLSSVNI